MPEGFKIASAYVEVRAELDQTSARAAANEAAAEVETRLKTAGETGGKAGGEELKQAFDAAAAKAATDVEDRMTTAGSAGGKKAGTQLKQEFDGAASGLTAPVEQELDKTAPAASGAGKKAGEGFKKGFEDEVDKSLPETTKAPSEKLPEPFGPSGDKAAKNFAENFKAHEKDFTDYAKSLSTDFYAKFRGNSDAALDEVNAGFNKKMAAGGFAAASKFSEGFDKKLKSAADNSLSGSFSKAFDKAGIEAGDLIGDGIIGGIGNAFKLVQALPPEISVPIAAAVGTLGVVVVSALNAALLAGVGGLGLAAGIIAEAHNPTIGQAFSDVKSQFVATMKNAATPFEGQLEAAAGKFETAIDKMGPDLSRFLAAVAPAVSALAGDLSSAGEKITSGLADAGPAARSVLEAVGTSANYLGGAVKLLLEEISLGGDSSAQTLKLLAFSVATLIDTFGALFITADMGWNALKFGIESALLPLQLMLRAMSALGIFGGTARNILHDINSVLGENSSKSKDAASATDQYGASMKSAGSEAQKLQEQVMNMNDLFDKYVGGNISAAAATLSYKNELLGLKDSLDQNAKTFDINTAAGRANTQALNAAEQGALGLAEAARTQAQNMGQDSVQANNAFTASLSQSVAQMAVTMHQGGATQSQIEDMVASMLGVPKSVVSKVDLNGGLTAANLLALIKQREDSLYNKTVDIVYNERHYTSTQQIQPGHGGSDPGGWLGSLHGLAFGGLHGLDWNGARGMRHAANGLLDAGVYSDGPIMFAEKQTGGEAFIPRVTPNPARAEGILDTAAGWYGKRTVPVNQSAPAPPTVVHNWNFYPGSALPTAEQMAEIERRQQVALWTAVKG